MRIILCGGAGFIGSHLLSKLSKNPENSVVVIDNLRTGKREFIEEGLKRQNVEFIEADLSDLEKTVQFVKDADVVYNLVANADIRGGTANTGIDLKYNLITAYNILEAMRRADIGRLVFFSSSGVYGEPNVIPTPENYSPMLPCSLYGASKIAGEAYVSAFGNSFGINSRIVRLVNIVGKNGTHGVIGDFIEKLEKNSNQMEILGDGNQLKSFLHISDCLDAVDAVVSNSDKSIDTYNIANDDWIDVKSIADIVAKAMGLEDVKYSFTGGERGWIGDAPKVRLSIEKINKIGWKPKFNSRQSVEMAAKEMIESRK
ncbi:MAG: NAD-dependent epimerase/dehydratase family protein [Candidatus Diapherotrites archaeon]